MAKFSSSLDIANRCIQHLGVPRISAFTDNVRQASETSFIYDKVKRAEMRRAVWTNFTRRMIMRPKTPTTSMISFTTYSNVVAYTAGDIVADSTGFLWLCLTANTGTVPGSETFNPKWVVYFGPLVADAWSAASNYVPGDMVYVTGTLGVIYICVAATTNNTPPNATFWHVVQSATSSLITLYAPFGYNPAASSVRTLFFLPANYIRLAPQEPKQPANSISNVTAGMRYSDWEIEGGLIASAVQTTPFVLRFVADQADVNKMDDMFCESVAARMATELCEIFTQSQDKLSVLLGVYKQAVMAARMVSAIEAGTTEDDFEEQAAQQPQRGGRG